MVRGVLGMLALLITAWVVSENRRVVSWRPVIAGLALQVLIALLMLKAPFSRRVFIDLNLFVTALQDATQAGTSFVFGFLGGGPAPFPQEKPGASFILAFQALPLVIVIAALSALLYYWRILPLVVQAFSWCLRKTMGIGGALGRMVSTLGPQPAERLQYNRLLGAPLNTVDPIAGGVENTVRVKVYSA